MVKANNLFLKIITGFGGVLLVVFIFTLLSGCSGNSENPDNPPPESTTNQNQLSGEISIADFNDSEYLKVAAKKYQETHEGVTINIVSYSQEKRDRDKYSQIINTALMSGKAEDIIDVSPLSLFKLAEKDMLLSLDDLIPIDPNEYYSGPMNAYKYNGKRYTFPLCFSLNAYEYTNEGANNERITLEKLIALSKENLNNKNVMLFDGGGMGMSDVDLAYKLFSLNQKDFIDMENKSVDVDSDKFISILKTVKEFADNKQVDSAKQSEKGESLYNAETASLIRQFLVYSPSMSQNGTIDYSNMVLFTNDEGDGDFFTTSFMPAINSNSQNKELAADFMKYLISFEMQTSPELLYCPVNKNAVAEASKFIYEDSKAGGYLPDGFNENTLDNNITKFDELAENATIIDYADRHIHDFVRNEMSSYFADEVNAEQAAKNLQSKLNIYLKE